MTGIREIYVEMVAVIGVDTVSLGKADMQNVDEAANTPPGAIDAAKQAILHLTIPPHLKVMAASSSLARQKLNLPFFSNTFSVLTVQVNLQDSGEEFATFGQEQLKYQDEKQPEVNSRYEKQKSKKQRRKANQQRKKKDIAIED